MTLLPVAAARRLQHRGDLDRMMAVVVDDGDAADLAGLGEAALDPAEPGQGLAQHLVGDLQLLGHCDRGQRVDHVVLAEHRQLQPGRWSGLVPALRSAMTTSKALPP